jgi:hypothetical protein
MRIIYMLEIIRSELCAVVMWIPELGVIARSQICVCVCICIIHSRLSQVLDHAQPGTAGVS